MKDTTKRTWKNVFGSLIRNDSCVDGGKNSPWWIGLILAILGTILPIIPIMTTVGTSYGAQIFSSYSYSMEVYATSAFIDVYSEGYEFTVSNNHFLVAYKDGELAEDIDESTPIASYVSTIDSVEQIQFQLYYSTSSSVSDLLDEIENTTYVLGTTLTAEEYDILYPSENEVTETTESTDDSTSEEEELSYYIPSFIILYRGGIYTYIASSGTTDSVSSVSGDWSHFSVGTNLLESLLSVEGYDSIDTSVGSDGHYNILRDSTYTSGVFSNLESTLNTAYLKIRTTTFWTYTGVFFGVYVVLVVFMGLMTFLLTRGKKNPMNYLSFWTTTKICMWASFSPGLLAMILGFMFTSYATMFFIILYGIRIMWLSMRQLRPQN